MLRRGDLVTVVAPGDYGKPRPAVIVQNDAVPVTSPSVVVCLLTTTIENTPTLRVTVEPSPENGLRDRSQVMTDKPTTLSRERIGRHFGRLDDADMERVTRGLSFIVGVTPSFNTTDPAGPG